MVSSFKDFSLVIDIDIDDKIKEIPSKRVVEVKVDVQEANGVKVVFAYIAFDVYYLELQVVLYYPIH